MRRVLRRVRNTCLVVVAGTTAWYAGLEHGRLRAALEHDHPDLDKRRRAYLRARGVFRAVVQRSYGCDRAAAEDTVESFGFPRVPGAPVDLH